MANANVNKVVIGGVVKLDLTGDTVTADKLDQGIIAHDKSGAVITGTSTKNADTSDSTASVDEVLAGEVFHTASGAKATGTMPNRGKVTGTISTKAGKYTIPNGYHDGSGTVAISSAEQAKLVAANIRSGVTILGVAGSMSPGEDVVSRAAAATPTFYEQVIVPGEGYTHLSQVTVNAIPVSYTDNAQGGQTLTVGV